MQVQSHCRVCPVCKAGIEQDKARPQSDGLPSTCCPWPRPEGVKALAADVPSRLAGGAYLRPRGREHGPAAEGPVQEEGCGGRERPQATSWAASRARAGAGSLIQSGGARSCVCQGVHSGCHPAKRAHTAAAWWAAQRTQLLQPGNGNLQPGLGIIPTLFGLQHAPGATRAHCSRLASLAPARPANAAAYPCCRPGRLSGASDARAAAPGALHGYLQDRKLQPQPERVMRLLPVWRRTRG